MFTILRLRKKRIRTAKELLDWLKNMDSPNDIFALHKEAIKLPAEEQKALNRLGVCDLISMHYITAIEMKKKGTWDAYLEKWEKEKHITADERLEELKKKYVW